MAKVVSYKLFNCLNNREKIEYIDKILTNNIDDNIKNIIDNETINLNFIPYVKIVLKKKKFDKNRINKIIFDNLLIKNKYDVALSFNKTLSKKEKEGLLSLNYKKNNKYKIKKENKYVNIIPTVSLATILILESTTIISSTFAATSNKLEERKTTSQNTFFEKNNINEFSDEEILKTIDKICEEIVNSQIKFIYNNNELIYYKKDLGLSLNKENILNDIRNNNIKINYNLKNTILNQADVIIKNISYNDESINNLINEIYNKTKINKVNGVITKLDGNVIKTTNPKNGLELDKEDLKNKIININSVNSEVSIDLKMNEIVATTTTKDIYSSTINTLSSASTYYNESQARAQNIKIAASKLNGTVINPGEIFSYYKVVGPYDSSNGFVYYDKYVGSGICQVSTTLYNAQLKAGLETIKRSNHYEPVYYVKKGLDATVYGSSVDYQFKNNTDYPITIVASANNGVLTIGISGDNNILGGKSYLPRSVYITNKIYDAYLDVYKDGQIIETKYLGRSYYKY